MYSTCLFCHSALGANATLERFPVGRRLAFDSAKGRLWVVCRQCRRWNLTPVEERWEAIEDCERLYRATIVRVSTEQIGLARLDFAASRGAGEQGILGLGYEQRLSLEMAVHEDTERRALEGELAELETAWADAERVASIADNMFVPQAITWWLRDMRFRGA